MHGDPSGIHAGGPGGDEQPGQLDRRRFARAKHQYKPAGNGVEEPSTAPRPQVGIVAPAVTATRSRNGRQPAQGGSVAFILALSSSAVFLSRWTVVAMKFDVERETVLVQACGAISAYQGPPRSAGRWLEDHGGRLLVDTVEVGGPNDLGAFKGAQNGEPYVPEHGAPLADLLVDECPRSPGDAQAASKSCAYSSRSPALG